MTTLPKKSKIYTIEGNFKYIEDLYHGSQYFQKNIDIHNNQHKIELKIAQKLIISPQKNIVRVYDIKYSEPIHIKYELLDMDIDLPPSNELIKQLSTGIKNLHLMNCIYIDLKDDNIGFSPQDDCWKIFDFDCSGICTDDLKKWIIKPPELFMFKKIISIDKNIKEYILNNPISLSKKDIENLHRIELCQNLTKYDDIACFISFGNFLEK